jgi:hypothetical protein
MATISPSWTENVSVRTASTTAGSTTDALVSIDLDTLGADRSDIQITSVAGASPTVTFNIYSSSNSGTTDDDVPLMAYTVTASETRTISVTGPFISIEVVNNSASVTGNITIIHAWRQWTSA